LQNQWLSGLNPEQTKAALHNHGPLLILAGAGSGKTTVLVARTGRLIEEGVAKPKNICVLTFTNKAARELKKRVTDKLGKKASKVQAGTFHSFGLGILKKHYKQAGLPQRFGIIDASDSKSIVKGLLNDISNSEKDNFDADRILFMISQWREKGQKKAQLDDPYEEIVKVLLPKYINKLQLLGVVDFDSLLLKPIELFNKHPEILQFYQQDIEQLMVDEFQDTNVTQLQLVRMLSGKHNNIAVVGDDDQSIYGWRGAQVENILSFPKLYKDCKVVRLVRNYRSYESILSVANAVIEKNEKRHDKSLVASGYHEKGEPPEIFLFENEDKEAEELIEHIKYFLNKGFEYRDIAILYRSNSQGGLLEAIFKREKLPFDIVGGGAFFERKEIKDVMAYLRCSLTPNEVAFRRIINTPNRGIGETTLLKLLHYAEEQNISLFKAAKNWQTLEIAPNIGESIDQIYAFLKHLVPYVLRPMSGRSCGQELLNQMIQLGYRDYVMKSYKNPGLAQKRWALVESLSRIVDAFIDRGGASQKTLVDFLDAMELRDTIEQSEENKNNMQLMTLHASKGLEFPVVFILGCEEDILPHKTLGSDVSEERRLFYVGLTRAKKHLILTRAEQRRKYGKWQKSAPSRFLLDIPTELIIDHNGPYRPLKEGQRQSMLSDLFSKIDQKGSIEI
jgi:superfamily I DNA/RNA helicase